MRHMSHILKNQLLRTQQPDPDLVIRGHNYFNKDMNTDSIISLFQQYLNEEIRAREVRLPYACCLSTIGLDGFPNARFVSLKEIRDNQFIITGTLTSRKGAEINNDNRVALSFWWPETQRQVRIQGIAHTVTGEVTDRYFRERNLESRIVSVVSEQGAVMTDPEALHRAYEALALELNNGIDIVRPDNWGAYAIEPIRVEFLTFSETRFHDRSLYQQQDGVWSLRRLQP